MAIQWCEREKIIDIVKEHLTSAQTVLDVGCGIYPQNYIVPLVHICCDPFEQYVEHLHKKVETEIQGTYVILKASWKDIAEKLPMNCVDTVFLLDVIEHLEKEEGVRLLKLTERIAKKQIIVFTPIGYMPQEHEGETDAWGLSGVAYQQHMSGWFPDKDFDDSWDIYACKDFHLVNNMRIPLEKPYGAFWATKNLPYSSNHGKEENVLGDVNKVLTALEIEPVDFDSFLNMVLDRNANAVRKIKTIEEEKRLYAEEMGRLTHEMQVLNHDIQVLNHDIQVLDSTVNTLQLSSTYILGKKIAAIPWFFNMLKYFFKV